MRVFGDVSAVVVQDVVVIFDGDTTRQEIADRSDGPLLVHVTFRIIVSADDENARMMPTHQQDKSVQRLEVVVVFRQYHTRPLNGFQQMLSIRDSNAADVVRYHDVVSGRPQHLYENTIDRVVVEVQIHRTPNSFSSCRLMRARVSAVMGR